MTEYIYHYTDAGAVSSILINRSFWATDIQYLNDKNEGKVVRNIIMNIVNDLYSDIRLNEYTKAAIRQFLRSDAKVYMASFSKRRDNLSLYRSYCPSGGGYCVGFTEDYLKGIDNIKYVECVYCEKEQRDWSRMFVNSFLVELKKISKYFDSPDRASNELLHKTGLYSELIEAQIKYKANEFSSEEEVRVYASRVPNLDLSARSSRSGNLIIPYAIFRLKNTKTSVYVGNGPNLHDELACKGIQELARIATVNGSNWEFSYGSMLNSGYRYL